MMYAAQANTQNRRAEAGKFLEKIVINTGVGRLSSQPNFEEKLLPQIMRDLGLIAGQKPEMRRSTKSIAGFKLRQGQIVGLRVTLRGRRMVDFFERLITIILPRIRDFSGIDLQSVDAHGILSIGFREQFVFPEVNPEESPVVFPLGVSLVPSRKNRKEALERLATFGMPLKKK